MMPPSPYDALRQRIDVSFALALLAAQANPPHDRRAQRRLQAGHVPFYIRSERWRTWHVGFYRLTASTAFDTLTERLTNAFTDYPSTNRFAYSIGFDRPSRDDDPFAETIAGVGILSRETLGAALRARPHPARTEAAPERSRTAYLRRADVQDGISAHDFYAFPIAVRYLRGLHGDLRQCSLREIAAAYGIRLEHRRGAPALIDDVGFYEHARDISLLLAWDAIRREHMPHDERLARLIAAHILAQRAAEAMKEDVETYERSAVCFA